MKAKSKLYIIALFFAVISVGVTSLFIFPALSEIKRGANQIQSYKNETASLDIENSELESFKKNYDSYKPNLDKIDHLFVNSKDPISFIKFIENTSFESGIVSKISLANVDDAEKNPTKIVFQVESSGSFRNLLRFSEKLENGPYLVTITDLSFKKVPKSSDLEASFSIQALSN